MHVKSLPLTVAATASVGVFLILSLLGSMALGEAGRALLPVTLAVALGLSLLQHKSSVPFACFAMLSLFVHFLTMNPVCTLFPSFPRRDGKICASRTFSGEMEYVC
jgi:hypothetical protein